LIREGLAFTALAFFSDKAKPFLPSKGKILSHLTGNLLHGTIIATSFIKLNGKSYAQKTGFVFSF
jgi:hypothetical protein